MHCTTLFHSHHPLGLIGLAMLVISGLGLLVIPSKLAQFFQDGSRSSGAGMWSELPKSDAERASNLRKRLFLQVAYALAIALFIVGSILQGIDLLQG
jgi:hypothetical protein